MYVSILEYRVDGVDEAGWLRVCEEELAPRFVQENELLSAIWLRGEGEARGVVAVWQDKAGYDRFLGSELAERLRNHPNVAELTMRGFGVDEPPTRATRGLVLGAARAYQYAW